MSKRTAALEKKVERGRLYSVEEAVHLLKETAVAKFDETVEIALRLNVDPKQPDQNLRGAVPLPHGSGKARKVCVIARGEKIKEAEQAGADIAGGEEILQKIQDGWMDFDILVATPDAMPAVSRLGKILGPRGLMPNPKTGTVAMDVARIVREIKSGRADYRVDAAGNIHATVGKKSFPPEHLAENIRAFVRAVLASRPSSVKGVFVKTIAVSATMGPGIRIDPTQKF